MTALPSRSSCCFIDDVDYVSEHLNKLNRSLMMSMRRSISASGYAPSPTRHYELRFDHRQPHFLETCFLCRKSIATDSDIFMYRGDTPFCSEECRMDQMEMDEAKETRRHVSMKAGLQTNSNSNHGEGCGTVVTAYT